MTIIIMMPGLAYSDIVLQKSPEEKCKELQMALCAASEFEQAKAVLLSDAQSTVKSQQWLNKPSLMRESWPGQCRYIYTPTYVPYR